jgi:hypothetical protein
LVTRTTDETSVLCPADAVPAGVRCEAGWRCLRVAGTLDIFMVGVLAGLVGPLAAAGVSVFVVSTFDTDFLLVKEDRFTATVEVLWSKATRSTTHTGGPSTRTIRLKDCSHSVANAADTGGQRRTLRIRNPYIFRATGQARTGAKREERILVLFVLVRIQAG